MAKRPRPRKRAKKSDEAPDKHEQAAIAQLTKHTKEYEEQARKEEADDAAEPAHGGAPLAPSAEADDGASVSHDAASAPAHVDAQADASSDDEGKPQKKRKRTRKRRKEAKPGPDPASVPGLGEAAQRAIAYAQTYLRDRDAWKFSKPRQNWLMRHILWSERIFHAAKQLADVADDTRRTLPDDLQACIAPALQLPDEGAWIPDEHVAVVAVYLQSIMGLGKQVRDEEDLPSACSKHSKLPQRQACRTCPKPHRKRPLRPHPAAPTPPSRAKRPRLGRPTAVPPIPLRRPPRRRPPIRLCLCTLMHVRGMRCVLRVRRRRCSGSKRARPLRNRYTLLVEHRTELVLALGRRRRGWRVVPGCRLASGTDARRVSPLAAQDSPGAATRFRPLRE